MLTKVLRISICTLQLEATIELKLVASSDLPKCRGLYFAQVFVGAEHRGIPEAFVERAIIRISDSVFTLSLTVRNSHNFLDYQAGRSKKGKGFSCYLVFNKLTKESFNKKKYLV